MGGWESALEPPYTGSQVPRARVSHGAAVGGRGRSRWCWWGMLVGPSSSPLPCTGIQRFCRDIHMMLGFKPGLYFRACWLFLSPATLLVTKGKEGWGPELRGGAPSGHSVQQGCPGPEQTSVRAEG